MNEKGRSRGKTQMDTVSGDRYKNQDKQRRNIKRRTTKKRKKNRRMKIKAVLGIVIILAAGYFALNLKYSTVFSADPQVGRIPADQTAIDEGTVKVDKEKPGTGTGISADGGQS